VRDGGGKGLGAKDEDEEGDDVTGIECMREVI